MTVTEMKVNALVLIEIGSPEEQEEGRKMLRILRKGLIPAPTLEDTVDELLERLGLAEGWQYIQILRTALIQAYQHPGLMDCASRGVYRVTGEIYQVPADEVCRSITRCIATAYKRCDNTDLDAFFRHQLSEVTGMPTPVSFLRRCLKELRCKMQVAVSHPF